MISNFNYINDFLALHTYENSKYYDLILVLGSANPYIVLDAYSLYKKGHSAFFMISGGIGHTTQHMANVIKEPIYKDGLSEARMLFDLVSYHYGEDNRIILEEHSTNCGENILFSMDKINQLDYPVKNVLLIHDPLMQRRIDLTAKKMFPHIQFDNFCCFIPKVCSKQDQLQVVQNYRGLWSFEQYVSLLLGEMKRVIDNEDGYGPKGTNYIEHIDVPSHVLKSYTIVQNTYKNCVRK